MSSTTHHAARPSASKKTSLCVVVLAFVAGHFSSMFWTSIWAWNNQNGTNQYLRSSMEGTVSATAGVGVDTGALPPNVAIAARNDQGWSTIDVFYGTTRHLEIPAKYKGKSWYSQVTQDQVVAGLLLNKTNGYFIDLAANDAVSLSNTFGLEQNLNWTGLCIEANSQYWKRLAFHKCKVIGAVVGAIRDEEVTFQFKGEYGGIANNNNNKNDNSTTSAKVSTVPLLEILQRNDVPHEIDYLSLDVEGAEAFILMQLFPTLQDLGYRIRIMTIERLSNEGRDFMKQYGYQENVRLGAIGEGLYVHESVYDELDWAVTTDKFDCAHLPDFTCTR
eukprot:scaffold37111_cov290-Amphora_coffeaeformis.AAC.1